MSDREYAKKSPILSTEAAFRKAWMRGHTSLQWTSPKTGEWGIVKLISKSGQRRRDERSAKS
jgi:hypothetical protein